jgi:hypothetical protein
MKNTSYTKIRKTILLLTGIIFISMATFSCSSEDKDDIINSVPDHEHDEISKIVLKFSDIADPSVIQEFIYEVPEGTTELPVTDINLPEGTYTAEINFYAPHGDHYHNVTDEIFMEDADDHFVFYQEIDSSGLTIAYAEDDRVDTLGRKLGYRTVWTLSQNGGGKIYIYLIHQPAKKDPNAPSAGQLGGEIDMEAHFNIKAD